MVPSSVLFIISTVLILLQQPVYTLLFSIVISSSVFVLFSSDTSLFTLSILATTQSPGMDESTAQAHTTIFAVKSSANFLGWDN